MSVLVLWILVLGVVVVRGLVAGALIALFSISSYSSEIDSFTERYTGDRQNALPQINEFTNQRIQKAMRKANRKSKKPCDQKKLMKYLKKQLKGGFVAGPVEAWVNKGGDGTVDISRLSRKESIFKHVNFWNNFFMFLSKDTIGAIVNIEMDDKIHYVGADKFGHFFTEGYKHYEIAFKDKKGIDEAIKWSQGTERGIFGLATSGVYSFADLVANYNGMVFWKNIFEQYDYIDSPYFKCVDNQWKQIKSFDWSDYIDASWDEGINCSAYRNKHFHNSIQKSLNELHEKQGWDFQCPVEPRKCIGLGKKYGKHKGKLLNDHCEAIQSEKDVYRFLLRE